MKIGLFIPCFMNELYPKASMATLKLLENLDIDVEYPIDQTCCGQPMANTGCSSDSKNLAQRFVKLFKKYDYIVAPTGSCVTMVKDHYMEYFEKDDKDYKKVKNSIYELCEFLHDVAKIDKLNVSFPHKIGIHNSCHGLRGLKLGSSSELNIAPYSKLKNLLSLVKDIEIVTLKRDDECCGFGGTFCITEPDISVAMGKDRIKDHEDAGVQYITGADMSCLMHMEGLINKENKRIEVLHISQILLGEDI